MSATTVAPATAACHRTRLEITGMTCGACSARVERVLMRVPGVTGVTVNFATGRAEVDHDTVADLETLLGAVRRAGYGAERRELDRPPPALAAGDVRRAADERGLRRRLVVAWPLTVAAVVLSMGWPHQGWARWTVAALVTPVELWAGYPFLRGAVDRARHRTTSMDTLVAIGTLAAVGYSTYELLTSGAHLHDVPGRVDVRGHLHYDMAALIISFLLLGRWIESRARRIASSAIQGILALTPGSARLVTGRAGEERERSVPVADLRVGDVVRVRPGDRIPADGTVVSGACLVDESMLSGEPVPVHKVAGDGVTGGTLVHGGSLLVTLTAVGADTALAGICRLVEEVQLHKAPIQRVADRVAGVFVPTVIGLSALTAVAWLAVRHDPAQATLAAVSVLVVACPCALGLATPVALMVGVGRAAALGILIRSGEVLEQSGRVDAVVLDKTGTLTTGRMRVHEVVPVGATRSEVLGVAAAVERASEHPVGRAVVEAAREEAVAVPAAGDFLPVTGLGARATVDGRRVTVGRARLLEASGIVIGERARRALQRMEARGRTGVIVAVDGGVAGVIAVGDTVRPEAEESVAALREMGIEVAMLTGDAEGPARAVADRLGIHRVVSGVLPAEKAAEVRRVASAGRCVAMVGDGINDAPSLAAADLGIAVGGGTDVAVEAAGIILLGTDLRGLPAALRVARATYSVIVQNLGWAFGYNTVAIPLAASGLLDPIVAGAAMGLSSVTVVVNSLRLLRVDRRLPARRRRGPARATRRRSLVTAWLAPTLLLGTMVGTAEVLSPARGQQLLAPAAAPRISSTALPGGGRLATYLDPAISGQNEIHLTFFDARGDELAVDAVSVLALAPDGRRLPLHPRRFGAGHYVADVRLGPGLWRMHVDATTADARRLSLEARHMVTQA